MVLKKFRSIQILTTHSNKRMNHARKLAAPPLRVRRLFERYAHMKLFTLIVLLFVSACTVEEKPSDEKLPILGLVPFKKHCEVKLDEKMAEWKTAYLGIEIEKIYFSNQKNSSHLYPGFVEIRGSDSEYAMQLSSAIDYYCLQNKQYRIQDSSDPYEALTSILKRARSQGFKEFFVEFTENETILYH